MADPEDKLDKTEVPHLGDESIDMNVTNLTNTMGPASSDTVSVATLE